MTPSDGVNHGFMFGVGIVDKARTAMSEAREWLRGTPTSRCSAGRSIVAPENPPTPISYRLVRASRSGPYSDPELAHSTLIRARRNPREPRNALSIP